VRYFCDNAEAVVLLTATPIQLGDNDLYNLLNLLRPDVISSPQAFKYMAEPNPYLNAAIEIARAAKDDWKLLVWTISTAHYQLLGTRRVSQRPRMQQILDVLADEDDSPEPV